MLDPTPYRAELETALLAVNTAAAAVNDLYLRQAAATYEKGDGSPVTDADLAVNQIIIDILRQRHPEIPILTEEGADDPQRLESPKVWIVDPIDGTLQFVQRTGNFDILIALVEDGRPVLGVALQPPTGQLCVAVTGAGAWIGIDRHVEQRVTLPSTPHRPPVVRTSIWFGAPDNLEAVQRVADRLGAVSAGASEIGFTPRILLAPQRFDALVGFRVDGHQRMAAEWDFAVGDLFLHEAGGTLTDLDGQLFRYNKRHPMMERGLVASLQPNQHAAALEAVNRVLADQCPA